MKPRKWLSMIFMVLAIISALSLVLSLLLGIGGFTTAINIPVMICLASICSGIAIFAFLSICNILKKARNDGVKNALKSLLLDFVIYMIICCIAYRLIEAEWSIWLPLGVSVLLTLVNDDKKQVLQQLNNGHKK